MESIEVVFLGRGGQGGKTASLVLAEALIRDDFNVQAFSEYGPERSGAPVKSFLRFSKSEILTNSQIEQPEFIIVLDDSLLERHEIAAYLSEKVIILINSKKDEQMLIQKYHYLRNYSFFCTDCEKIALEIYKKPIINICMLGFAIEKIYQGKNISKHIVNILDSKYKDKLNSTAFQKGTELI